MSLLDSILIDRKPIDRETRMTRTAVVTASLVLIFAAHHPVSAAGQTGGAGPTEQRSRQQDQKYVCPMHPEVVSKSAGTCPKCGMTLRAITEGGSSKDGDTKQTAVRGGDPPIRVPDAMVYDQNGNRLRFYTDLVKGKTVAINFIFTSCTTICPPLTATFRSLQRELRDRSGRDVALISISVDPETDGPEKLKAFAAKFGAESGWTFVTGTKPDIDGLLRALGAYVGDKSDHSPMILIGNEPAGYWTRTYGLAPPSAILKTINEAAAKATASLPARRPSDAAAGYFPNLVLTTQDNTPVHFYADLMKGRVVVINFVFTTCTGICPAMTANLVKVQEYLGGRLGRERLSREVNFISITVDPMVDTPEALKKYAEQYKVKPGWFFLTGKKENVDWVLYKLGGYVEDKTDHSTLVIIGNEATGQWLKLFAMSRPDQIGDAVVGIMEDKKQ
jgi:protein SCO1/2